MCRTSPYGGSSVGMTRRSAITWLRCHGVRRRARCPAPALGLCADRGPRRVAGRRAPLPLRQVHAHTAPSRRFERQTPAPKSGRPPSRPMVSEVTVDVQTGAGRREAPARRNHRTRAPLAVGRPLRPIGIPRPQRHDHRWGRRTPSAGRYSHSTLSDVRRSFRAVLEYAESEGVTLQPNVRTAKLPKDKAPRTKRRALTLIETARVAGRLHVVHQLVLWLLRVMGLRLGDAFGIDPATPRGSTT